MPALHREVIWQVNAISRVLKKSYTEREQLRMKNSATLPFWVRPSFLDRFCGKKGGYFEYLGIAKQTLPEK